MSAIDVIKRRLKEDRIPETPEEVGQKKKRPLNDRARKCLDAFNRKRDHGDPISMAQHCRDFCKVAGDDESVYRTLKDWSALWHKPRRGDKNGDNDN